MPIKRVTLGKYAAEPAPQHPAPPVKARKPPKGSKHRKGDPILAPVRKTKKANIGNDFTPDEKLGFGPLTQRACDLLVQLRRLEAAGGKLSIAAFMRQAVELSGKSAEQLADLQARIDASPVAGSIMVFIRKLSRALASPNFPSIPTKKLERLVWQFGSEDTMAALNIAGASLGDAIALAVVAATQRWPELFGTVENADQHRARVEELHLRLTKIYRLMKDAYTSSDVTTESRSLTPTDRAKGLVCVRLKKFQSIHLGLPDWPQLMIAAELRASGGPPSVVEPAPEPAPQSGPMSDAAKAQLLRTATTAVVIPMQSAM